MDERQVLFTNDAVVLGILCVILAAVFKTSHSSHPVLKRFYSFVPALLLCYFIPSVLTSLKVYDPEQSNLYYVSSRYLLPASLILLTLSIDLKEVLRLGPKAIAVFFAGTVGVVAGGPISLLLCQWLMPGVVAELGVDSLWRGMATVAGSWIGGGANQTSMKEIFEVDDQLFSAMITVDVLVANVWMAVLLFGAQRAEKIDRRTGADDSVVRELIHKMAERAERGRRIPSVADLFMILAVGLGCTALAHVGADLLAPWLEREAPWSVRFSLTSPFFWLIVIATTAGIGLSFTRCRELEGAGASKVGTVFLYLLIASIGMKMDITAIFEHRALFLVGLIWIAIHAAVLLTVGRLVRAPFFLIAVGSQANIGGAASAPVVAGAFHPALAPVGVLLAVVGYGVGTYAAYLCAQIMRVTSGG